MIRSVESPVSHVSPGALVNPVILQEMLFRRILCHAKCTHRSRVRAVRKGQARAVKHTRPPRSLCLGPMLRVFVSPPRLWHQRLETESALPHFLVRRCRGIGRRSHRCWRKEKRSLGLELRYVRGLITSVVLLLAPARRPHAKLGRIGSTAIRGCGKSCVRVSVLCIFTVLSTVKITGTLNMMCAHLPSPCVRKPRVDLLLCNTALLSQPPFSLCGRVWIVLVDVQPSL